MEHGLCLIFLIIVLLCVFCFYGKKDSFTLPFAGGYVYPGGYGGMADKEVEADSLMT